MLRRIFPVLSAQRRNDVRLRPVPLDGAGLQWIAALRSWRPDGLLIEFEPERIEASFALNLPTVVMLEEILSDKIGCVTVDEIAIGKQAAAYLKQRGLPHLTWIDRDNAVDTLRRDAFVSTSGPTACEGLQVTPQHNIARILEKPGKRLCAWLKQLPKPAGIFATDEYLGWQLNEAARLLNIRIPEDICILTVATEEEICQWADPSLSTVDLPWESIARSSMENLLAMIQSRKPRPGKVLRLPPRGITTRDSTDFTGGGDPLVEQALALIRNQGGRPLLVKDIVTALATNRRSLERAFHATLNKSPKQVLAQTRMRMAQKLLQDSSHSIAEVADLAGFPSPENFSREFRKRFKRTPRDWRGAINAPNGPQSDD